MDSDLQKLLRCRLPRLRQARGYPPVCALAASFFEEIKPPGRHITMPAFASMNDQAGYIRRGEGWWASDTR